MRRRRLSAEFVPLLGGSLIAISWCGSNIGTGAIVAQRASGWNRIVFGAGKSSWRSASRYWHRRTELRCKDENPTQGPHPTVPAHGDVDSGQTQHHGLRRFRFTRFGSRLVEQGSAQGKVASPSSIGEHAVVAQPRESAREHMKKEAADELARVETHHLALVAVSVVAPSEANMLAIEVDESMIGDGGLVSVAPEVGDYIGCPGKRRFSILPIISNSRCATRTIRYSDKRPLCFARRPTTESAIFE